MNLYSFFLLKRMRMRGVLAIWGYFDRIWKKQQAKKQKKKTTFNYISLFVSVSWIVRVYNDRLGTCYNSSSAIAGFFRASLLFLYIFVLFFVYYESVVCCLLVMFSSGQLFMIFIEMKTLYLLHTINTSFYLMIFLSVHSFLSVSLSGR